MIIVNLIIFFYLFIYLFIFPFNKLYMPGSYVAFNLLPSDPFDLLASCIVSFTQRINKYVCMYIVNSVFRGSGTARAKSLNATRFETMKFSPLHDA